MRAYIAYTILIGALVIASPAFGDTELLVLQPAGAKGDVGPVKASLGKTNVGTLSGKSIEATCATDPGCLTKIGGESNAKRVLAITAGGGGKLTLMLVDVGAKLLLGTRDLTIAPKKLDKELGGALKKFVDEATVDKAKALFAEGNEHFNLGEFAQALERYKLAYRVKPLAAFQFNIAQCHRKLGQHQDAIAMYQAYLIGNPDAQNKATIESLIAESKKALAEQAATEQKRESERLAADQKKAIETRKAKEAEAAAASDRAKTDQARIAAEREREQQFNRHPARKWMLLTMAVGLATGGGGTYYALEARKSQRAFDAASCGDRDTSLMLEPTTQCEADRKKGQESAFRANVLIGSGGAVVLTSLLVFILDPGNVERPDQPQVSVTGSSVMAVFRW